MNRLHSLGLRDVRPELLPPTKREGRVRALFLSHTLLGFRRYHEQLSRFCEADDEIDATHVELSAPLWQKIVGKGVPVVTWTGWDLQAYRHLLMWRARLTKWLLRPLPMERFDVVHVLTQGNAPHLPTLQRRARERGLRAPTFALNIDATAKLEARELGYSATPLSLFARAEQEMFDACDLVVCRNAWVSRSLGSDYGVAPQKVQLARNAMKLPPRSRLDLPPRRQGALLKLAFVGNNWARKSGPELLRMHQARLSDVVELHVFSSKAVPDLSAKRVVWHGGVANARLMNEFLPRMDAFVLPTRNDMHPWAVLEASSVGLPVVTSRLAGIPEMVRHGETGFLCAPNDLNDFASRLLQLADDPQLCERMGEAARAHVAREYQPEESFGRLIERLKSLANDSDET